MLINEIIIYIIRRTSNRTTSYMLMNPDVINASFHRSEQLVKMCEDAGVKLIHLPPYSPDLNPIEDLKRGFATFVEWYINVVGAKEESARGHFRHAGLKIEQVSGFC